MDAGQLAALIAAGFFALGVCVGVYVLLRLAGLITVAHRVLTGYSDASDQLLRRAQATVDRADEQLVRTGALAESVEAVSASMNDLSEQVSAVAGSARLIAGGLGAPVLRIAAAGYGVRRALAVRAGNGRAAGNGPAAGTGRAVGTGRAAGNGPAAGSRRAGRELRRP